MAPENTLAAFTQALSAGVDGIELDVRLARDGVPVVIHDATLRRTGSRGGVATQLTSEELTKIDAGTWFNLANPKLARREYSEERIPTLAQVFELFRNESRAIYVELKGEKNDVADELGRSVVQLVRRFKFQRRVVLIGFDHAAIAAVKAFDSSIRTGALFGSTRIGGRAWRADSILAATADCGAEELLLHRLLARRKLIAKAHDANLPVVVWTVDDAKWLERARLLKLHAVMTNHPAKLLAAR